ncbi:hypothetical protein PAEAM_56290 [Paenibacillus sp. GM1FR]|uniref:hypothetical protein n=1 Tax=Paenibacillus sp. GM1FR TaxID=2059267 RepID=UPI000C270AB6|nr:hypothetical protein [Paenibacillus sp. GM1FR]PJN50017.1 hypothetical protein PAEAM_56290 [Paenibacillus sp. GM1FR]
MNIKNIISILIIIGPGLYFGYVGKSTEMGLAILSGAVAVAFMNIDKIQRFKGAGFEAEMKKAVEDAYATIENLKELATPLIITVVTNLTYSGRLGGMDPHRKHRFKDELKIISDKLLITDSELEDAMSNFHRYHTWDHISRIADEVHKEQLLSDEHRRKLSELRDYSSSHFPSVNEIKNLFIGTPIPERIQDLIDDYDYYLKNKKLRR